MVSLAAFRYSDVYAQDGGPIDTVLTGELSVFGRPYQQANAFLRPEIAVGKSDFAVFGQADGTGVDPDSSIACHMAISEALERWAFLALQDSPSGADFGFNTDASSNGMAAFPGLSRKPAQQRAQLEAIERHSLVAWWDGRLPAESGPSPYPGTELVRIHHNAGDAEVVILVQRSRAGQCYGHAAGRTLHEAIERAGVQLARAASVLVAHRAKGALGAPADFLERRALYFASDEGAARFERRLRTAPDKPAPDWRPVFNGEIPGPWSRWATVWRCAVAMPTEAYLDPTEDFFFW